MDLKNVDQPVIARVNKQADKVAPRERGRQWYLDPDDQPRYRGAAKERSKTAIPLVAKGSAKAEFDKPRMPRAVTDIPELSLEAQVPRVVKGVTQIPALADPRLDRGEPVGDDGAMGYVRMRVRLDNGELSILDSHLVEGPLREGAAFVGGYAYDVTLGDELLHAGPTPDLGERRSFIAPNPAAGEDMHHITEVSEAIFTVRVPAEKLTRSSLGDVRVRLFRLKDEAAEGRLVPEPLDRRFPDAVRVVAETRGLPTKVLPREILRRGGVTGQGAPSDG